MLEVIDKNVTEIAGQKLVPMKETEVRLLHPVFPVLCHLLTRR